MIDAIEIRKANIDAKIARLKYVMATSDDLIRVEYIAQKIENEMAKRKALKPKAHEVIKNTYVTSDAYWRNLTRKY